MGAHTTKTEPVDEPGSSVPKGEEVKRPGQIRTPAQIRTFLSVFTVERFKKNPDLYRKRMAALIDDQIRHTEVTTALLRSLGPELRRQKRQLGFLNMKCRTIYERLCFIRELRQNAGAVIRNFNLFTGKSLEDVVSEAPPLLKNAVKLQQIRWRKALASSKWQKDYERAEKELALARERYENGERELEMKEIYLKIYRKILASKNEFTGLSDESKLKKVESILFGSSEFSALQSPRREEGSNGFRLDLKRSSSSSSTTSRLSEDESCWDDFWESNAAMMDQVVAHEYAQCKRIRWGNIICESIGIVCAENGVWGCRTQQKCLCLLRYTS
ncbi:hypothetical protein GCK32_002056 [Trichostrongylus colubriformis]|uniref:Uncharacterized protein n=1 Tax=Trichostrongylus colubriformis TaxID=6319 RepID=A0AAN8F5I2_TRICO